MVEEVIPIPLRRRRQRDVPEHGELVEDVDEEDAAPERSTNATVPASPPTAMVSCRSRGTACRRIWVEG